MSTISRFPIKNLLSQFNKRDQTDNQGGNSNDDRSPAVIAGLVIAALTLLLAAMSYRRPRFGRSQAGSSLLPSHFVNTRNPLHQVPRNVLPDLSATIPPTEFPRAGQVFIYNDYSNAQFAGAHLSTFSYRNDTISSGDTKHLGWFGNLSINADMSSVFPTALGSESVGRPSLGRIVGPME
ncbi:hypothetical protein B9Z19DRAFT_1108812 [Tuber borchii]|uniref:Uncharacterized protein n=1 Tax=Tuber borchii TaxID=42251 RepID=A0A2T6ZQ20_TUBBO|nr:hypothetical protein B9Z19DRAFT_1108812 [Tuber borchii]